jgi:prepilin-type N-terminal cleavage/methylation domain-containing protein
MLRDRWGGRISGCEAEERGRCRNLGRTLWCAPDFGGLHVTPARPTRGSAAGRGARPTERGVTLVELLIVITLVAALAVGMLMAIRSSLTTMDRINARLEGNRRVMGIQQIVSSQIGGVIPMAGGCQLNGTPQSLQLVTTYSIGEGARGFPHVVAFRVVQDPAGGLQLEEIETPYTEGGGCGGSPSGPGSQTPGSETLVLARRLFSCKFSYHAPPRPDGGVVADWVDSYSAPLLPSGIRIETVPLDGVTSNLPALAVNAQIHVTRLQIPYLDDYE